MGSAYRLPVSDQSFDVIFSIMVWHLLSDLEKAASELNRALADDGKFLIITANPDAYIGWKALYSAAKITGNRLEGTMQLGEAISRDVLYLHTLDELKDSFRNVGLSITLTETFFPTKDSPKLDLLIAIQGKRSAKF